MTKYTVLAEQVNKRLDLAIVLLDPRLSRSSARKLLDEGKVKLNDAIEYRPQIKVKLDDVVELELNTDLPPKQVTPYNLPLEIIYEDDYVLAVNKPSGLKVHPTQYLETDTLLNALYFNLQDRVTSYGLNLINRIDQQTSGLVLVAKSADSAWFYSKLFSEGNVDKKYLAVVRGNWAQQFGETVHKLANHLQRDKVTGSQVISNLERGDYAVTEILPVEYDTKRKLSLVSAMPRTGRTHQIRVQLAHAGFPIVGDIRYGGLSADRLLLHAHTLRLSKFPQGELTITAPVPNGFWPVTI